MLKDLEIQQAWLEYCSGYPHVSAYFKNAPQYTNLRAEVDGKSVARKINLYMVFTEQCFNLLKKDGHCGTVIPSGIYTDLGAKQLREMLYSQSQLKTLFGLSNERFLFEGVDHRFKIALLVFSKNGHTETFEAAFRANPGEAVSPEKLDSFLQSESEHIKISVPLVRRLSPDSLSIMEFKGDLDVSIAEKTLRFPLLGEDVPGRWRLKLTQELNMTSDSYLFHKERKPGMLPLYEGKMIHQFTHQWDGGNPRYWLDESEARKAVIGIRGKDTGQRLDYQSYRLGFRDIARSTDTRTFISSIIPPAFHGNKLPTVCVFGDKGSRLIDNPSQLFLCCVWNSLVIDYNIRQRVSATLNFFYIYQLSVPRYCPGDPYFDVLISRAARLICTTSEFDDLAKEVGLHSHKDGVTDEVGRAKLRAEIDGIVAHLYGLTEAEFTHILSTFPLVPEPVKVAARNAYRDVERGLIK